MYSTYITIHQAFKIIFVFINVNDMIPVNHQPRNHSSRNQIKMHVLLLPGKYSLRNHRTVGSYL